METADPTSDTMKVSHCCSLFDACEKQHNDCAKNLLLERSKDGCDALAALVNEKNDKQQTPLHIVAENGNVEIADLLINKNGRCSEQDRTKKTPLMVACDNNHNEVVRILLKKIPKSSEELNLQCSKGYTALHYAVVNDNEEIVFMLINHEADGSIKDKHQRIPMLCACKNNHKGIVEMLLKTGYENSPVTYYKDSNSGESGSASNNKKPISILIEAIDKKQEDIAIAIISSIQAREALEFSFDEETDKKLKKVDALRRAIERRMPALVERIFIWCTNRTDEVKATFEYMLINDLADLKSDTTSSNNNPTSNNSQSLGTEEQANSTSTIPAQSRYDPNSRCLNLLINSKESVKLVRHPLVTSLLYQKWTVYAQLAFALNLLLHLLYTLSLTIFATTVYQPGSEACIYRAENSSSACEAADGHYISAGVFSSITFILSILRLCFEVFEMAKLGRTYFFDWINYLELCMCIFSVIFVFVFTSQCFCPASWQWQIGTLSVFFAWIDLIYFSTIIPMFGIYVVMFGTIVKNFLHVAVLAALLIMSFTIPFYMLLHDPLLNRNLRTPFQDVGRTFMKTLTMTAGEFEYDTLFRQDYTEGPDLPYGVSFLFWVAFIFLMHILLNNLLIGLAVDDVNEIRENAKIKTLCIWVYYLQLIEQLLPLWFYNKHQKKIKSKFLVELKDFPKKRHFWRGFKWLEEPFNGMVRMMWYNALEFDNLVYNNRILPNDPSKDTEKLLSEVHQLTTEVETMKKKLVSIDTLKEANVELLNAVRRLTMQRDKDRGSETQNSCIHGSCTHKGITSTNNEVT